MRSRLRQTVLRVFDFTLAGCALLVVWPVMAAIALMIALDVGSPIFKQVRVGRHRRLFTLYKFRTMRAGTPSVATHLVEPGSITPLGRWLRHKKLDELPQLWNVFKGEMSLVGPRPCLPEQTALIAEREVRGVFAVRPGITGLAQLSGIDMSDPLRLAETDAAMLRDLTLPRYLHYLWLTLLGRGWGDPAQRPNSDAVRPQGRRFS